MAHQAKNYEYLIGQVKGLSETQLRNHFELYKGYVKKTNEIEDRWSAADPAKANYSFADISEIQRRRAVAYNGAHLHELYFENLTGETTKPSEALEAAIIKAFGSMEKWEQDTLAGLKTANGWVLLCRSHFNGAISNNIVEEHHSGLLVAQDILLAIDGWEHAFMIDYGIKEADYFQAIKPCLDWNKASKRFDRTERHLHLVA